MLYETQRIAGRGLGLVAGTIDIPVGTCFMSANPTITLRSTEFDKDVSSVMIYDTFRGLTKAQKERWLQLTFPSNTELDRYMDEIRQHEAEYVSNAVVDLKEASEVVARFHNNTFVRDDWKTRDVFLQPAGPSQIDHSCVPNTSYGWNSTSQKWDFRAMKVIKKSEEITISYLPGIDTSEIRRYRLRLRFGFDCLCKACDTSKLFGQLSTMRRSLLAYSNDRRFSGTRPSKIEACRQTLGLLEREEITGWEVWRTQLQLGKLYAESAMDERAVHELTEASELAVSWFGSEHAHTKESQDLLRETRIRFGYDDAEV